ncbi:hypothetical protein ACJZ2D_013619 [Fusarium nematophilum]
MMTPEPYNLTAPYLEYLNNGVRPDDLLPVLTEWYRDLVEGRMPTWIPCNFPHREPSVPLGAPAAYNPMHAQIEHSLDVSIWPPPTKSAAAAAAAATEQSSALAPDPLRPNCSDDGESAVSGVSEERGHEFMDGEGGHHGIHGGGDAEDRDGIDGLLRNDVLDSGEDADDEDSSYDTLINDTLDAEMEHYLVGGYGIHHEGADTRVERPSGNRRCLQQCDVVISV